MLYAFANDDDLKTTATPGARALCPTCGGDVVAKCGEINRWHWSHVNNENCIGGDESPWHRWWKSLVKPEFAEVPHNGHRADIMANGRAIEFQHSSIDVPTITDREATYDALTWVFDMAHKSCQYTYWQDSAIDRGRLWIPHYPRTINICQRQMFFDMGTNSMPRLFEIIEPQTPVSDWPTHHQEIVRDLEIDYETKQALRRKYAARVKPCTLSRFLRTHMQGQLTHYAKRLYLVDEPIAYAPDHIEYLCPYVVGIANKTYAVGEQYVQDHVEWLTFTGSHFEATRRATLAHRGSQ